MAGSSAGAKKGWATRKRGGGRRVASRGGRDRRTVFKRHKGHFVSRKSALSAWLKSASVGINLEKRRNFLFVSGLRRHR